MHKLCFNKIHFHSPTYTPLFSPKFMHSYFSNLLCSLCALSMYMGVRPSSRGWVASQGCIHEENWLSLLEDLSVTEGSSESWGFLSHLPSMPGFIPTWVCNGLVYVTQVYAMSDKCHFTADVCCHWILPSFHLLFQEDPWALEGGVWYDAL